MKFNLGKNRIIFVSILVIVLCFNTFSAVVSDNDGAAFVTKSEFEELKSNFASQINGYNNSIDGKIDGSIASYLAGINLAKKIELKRNLDEYGKLSTGILLKWNSATNTFWGSASSERIAIESFTLYGYGDNTGRCFGYSWPKWTKSSWGDDLSVENRKYWTSKKVNLKLDDGSKVTGYQRLRAACYINWWYTEWQPNDSYVSGGSWAPSACEEMNFAYTSVKQNSKTLLLQNTDRSAWWSFGSITVDTHDIADDGESYTITEILCPNSIATEMYWDSTKNDQSITKYGGKENRSYNSAINLNWKARYKDTARSYTSIIQTGNGPTLTDGWSLPWMKLTTTVQDMYLETLNAVDSRHRQIKNGLILGTTEKKGTYTIEAEATSVGKLYVYIGKTPISNWAASDFKGKVKEFTEANKKVSFEIKDVGEENVPVWICYLPAATNVDATLKVISFNYMQDW